MGKMECANTCMKRYEEDGGCLAISFYSTTSTSYCYHYSYGQFIQSNKMISTLEKAYAKCLGKDEEYGLSKYYRDATDYTNDGKPIQGRWDSGDRETKMPEAGAQATGHRETLKMK